MQWLCLFRNRTCPTKTDEMDGLRFFDQPLRLIGNVRAFESDRFVKRIVIVLNGVEKRILLQLIATKSLKDRFK